MPTNATGAYDDNVVALLREARVSATRAAPREVQALLDRLTGWRDIAAETQGSR